jgi:conjugal transfer pilin signal peptidase TrbI
MKNWLPSGPSWRFPAVLWAMVGYLAVTNSFLITVNLSDSLPGTLFVIDKRAFPKEGELLAFRWARDWPYPAGSIFVKRLSGRPGAVVSATGSRYFVDGREVGVAKSKAKTGALLQPGPIGVIPPGHYFVSAEHPDSLDSRYALTGWISDEQVLGKAVKIF